ncbi:MAG: hypothetical protein AB7V46_12430 [Thermomicrobiales bacterium]
MRAWTPLGQRKLVEILKDSERESPDGVWSPDDVYRLACEVQAARAKPRDGRLGRLVTPSGRHHSKRGQTGVILAVCPSGTAGILNAEVFVILVNGLVVSDAAENWRFA